MDKKFEITFMGGATSEKFEVEIKYTGEGPERYFNISNNDILYGLLYCDKITDREFECPIKKVFDYKNKKIILEIGF